MIFKIFDNVLEDTCPDVYFNNLIKKLNAKIKNQIFTEKVLISVLQGYDTKKINSKPFKTDNKTNKNLLKSSFYHLVFLHLMCAVRDSKSKNECTSLLKAYDKLEKIVNKEKVLDLSTNKIYDMDLIRYELYKIAYRKFEISTCEKYSAGRLKKQNENINEDSILKKILDFIFKKDLGVWFQIFYFIFVVLLLPVLLKFDDIRKFLGENFGINWENVLGASIGIFISLLVLTTIVYCICGFLVVCWECIINSMKKISINNYSITGLITFGFLFYTVICQPSEYGFYQVLRWLVSVFSAWTSVKIYQNSPKSFWLLLFAALTIIFNPVLPLKFEDDTWVIIDIITLAIFFIYCVRNIIKNME